MCFAFEPQKQRHVHQQVVFLQNERFLKEKNKWKSQYLITMLLHPQLVNPDLCLFGEFEKRRVNNLTSLVFTKVIFFVTDFVQ